MLSELRVENLLLIERAELRLDPGLNAITGETGAGKTVLTHALDMLLGGRPKRGIVRPGAREAYVEGVFTPPQGLAADPELAEIAERVPLDAEEIVVARRVTDEGRTRAFVQSRAVPVSDLRALGERLIAFYGQHEHRKLTLASAQLEVLDAFCGDEQLDTLARYERERGRARALETELASLRERAGARERDLDLLEFELQEIQEAAPVEGEESALEVEQARLGAVEELRQAALGALSALEPSADASVDWHSANGDGALASLAESEAALSPAVGTDATLDGLAERLSSLAYEAQDLAGELRRYESALEADPERLAQIEERLELLTRLKRKHGGSVAAVLEHADRCRTEHALLERFEESTASLEADLASAVRESERLAATLRKARRRGARELERAVRAELGRLAMAEASFDVALSERQSAPDAGALGNLGPRGADGVELLIAPNRGVPAGKLREIASGGELSRVMLALMSVSTTARGGPTVVFDEVDAGIGGNTARTVGERLSELARRRQVVCITHLPQVASLAARHFRVVKDAGGDLARADVETLEQGEVVGELCRMLGASAEDGAARRHAERLLRAA